jgi:hypothetical protein
MKHRRHFDASDVAFTEAERIRGLIADLDRLVQILDCDIVTEEERAGAADRSEAVYPMLARTLATRRDNLKGTVAALKQRLRSTKVPIVEQVVA